MTEGGAPPEDQCFLCQPSESLVFQRGDDFYAMLGLGAIVEGYSLIATTAHHRSMLDLPAKAAADLDVFTRAVRHTLRSRFGPVVLAEHGRVPPCEVRQDEVARDAHCFHAHRLVFPLVCDLTTAIRTAALSVAEFPDFLTAREAFAWPDEYLYFEREDGSCVVGAAPLPAARQFFRSQIARIVGRPEHASWRAHPRYEVIATAMEKLKGSG